MSIMILEIFLNQQTKVLLGVIGILFLCTIGLTTYIGRGTNNLLQQK